MGLAAPGQLIDRYAAILLPGAIGHERGFVGRIGCKSFAKLAPAADQAIEMRKI